MLRKLSKEARTALRARDIMHREVITVPGEAPLWEVARLFSERGITGAPVVDEEGNLLGVVSQTDIVRHIKETAGSAEGIDFYGELEPDGRGPFGRRVTARDLMSPAVIQVGEDTPVRRLSRLMLRRRVHRVIITRDKKIAGIVTTMDLLKVL